MQSYVELFHSQPISVSMFLKKSITHTDTSSHKVEKLEYIFKRQKFPSPNCYNDDWKAATAEISAVREVVAHG